MTPEKCPSFLIIGGPKCGTTSLSEYLRNHDNVFFTDPKEPHFWAEDLPRQRSIQSEETYLDLFNGIEKQHQAAGEGSVWSLYSQVALERIKAFNPNAKIIVMVRNPVEVVQSLHSFWVAINMEDQLDLRKAWDLQSERKQGKYLPRASKVWELYQYADIPKFGAQLIRALSVFPSEQLKIIFFEDFTANTDQVFNEVLEFLELPKVAGKTNFEVHNENKVPRSTFIASAIRRIPTLLDPYVKKFKAATGIKNLRVMHHLHKLEKRINQKSGKREAISDKFRAEIAAEFIEDIQLLEEITERDLSHWLKPKPRK